MADVAVSVPMLRPDQARIALHPARRKAVCMGRRYGKTVLGLVLVLSALLRGMRVAWLVPTYRNSNPLWRAVEAALAPLRKAGRAKLNRSDRSVELWNGGFLGIYTADNPDAMRGEWFHLVVTDEAARVPEAVIEEVVEPTLADVDGEHVAISSPKGKNWFYRMWRAGLDDGVYAASFQASTAANPSPLIRKAYERAKLVFGEDSNTFRQEWNAEFVDSSAVVWLREWAEDRYDPDDEALARSAVARIISYDTAMKDKVENAYTACVVADLLPDYRLLVRYVWRERLLFPNLVDAMRRDIAAWRLPKPHATYVLIEDVVSGTSAYQTLMASGDDALREMLHAVKPEGSKDQRFETAGVWIKNRRVLLPKPAASVRWLHAYEGEVFEEGAFKDQRDASSQVINWMQRFLEDGLHMKTEAA
jgi:phage terminase large subunit-like protein